MDGRYDKHNVKPSHVRGIAVGPRHFLCGERLKRAPEAANPVRPKHGCLKLRPSVRQKWQQKAAKAAIAPADWPERPTGSHPSGGRLAGADRWEGRKCVSLSRSHALVALARFFYSY